MSNKSDAGVESIREEGVRGNGLSASNVIWAIGVLKHTIASMEKARFVVRESKTTKKTFDVVYKSRIVYENVPSRSIADIMCKDYNDVARIHSETTKRHVEDISATLMQCYDDMETGLKQR